MRTILGRLAGALLALVLTSGLAAAQTKITIAVGGGACLCYLPTVLAKQLGEYDKAGLAVELVDLKGGSDALKAVLGGSADVVSGYFDHCVNLAAKKQELTSFVVYDRYPGLVLVVSPSHNAEIKSIKDLAGKKVGVSAPGSSTDFFLKYLLKKNGVDASGVAVIGVGLGATAVAAMQQGQIDAAVMLDPSVTVLQGSYPDLRILSDTRTQKDTLDVFGGEYPGGALYSTTAWIASHEKEAQALTNAIVNTLDLDPLAFGRRYHGENAAGNRRQEQGALSRRAQEHDPDVFGDRHDGPQGRRRGARGVQREFARGCEGQYRPQQDLHQQICRSGEEDDGDECEISRLDDASGDSPRHDARSRCAAVVVAVRGGAARRDISAFRRQAGGETAALERPHPARAQSGFQQRPSSRASYFETDFASFLAWRDWGFPDPDVFNGFGMGALRCADGAFVLGEMGRHTANAGRIYFPSGTPDLDDISDGTVDIAGSVAREVEEETGLTPADYRADAHWDCVVSGAAIAMIRILNVDSSGEALRARIEANLGRQHQPELSAIHLVRGTSDLTAAMPRFVTAFIEKQFSSRSA